MNDFEHHSGFVDSSFFDIQDEGFVEISSNSTEFTPSETSYLLILVSLLMISNLQFLHKIRAMNLKKE